MGRIKQKFDTLANTLYMLIALFMLGVALFSLIKGTLHYAWLIFAGGALYYLVMGLNEYIKGGEGYREKALKRLLLVLALAGAAAIFRLCL